MDEDGGGQPERLDYATPQRGRSLLQLAPDWRRRGAIAVLAAISIFALTFESAWRQARRGLWSPAGGHEVQRVLVDLQSDLDRYAKASGQPPATFQEVPAIQ